MTRSYLGKLLPLLVLAGGFVATYFLQQAAFNASRQTQGDYFDYQAREVVLRIEQRLAAYEQILLGAKGLFVASKSVDRDGFRDYVVALQMAKQYPGIQGVGFSLIIPPQEKARHIWAIRKEGYSDYSVRPEGERDLYTSTVFLEPFAGRNLRAFGYDMYSEAVRRAAMERARDLDKPAVSGKVRLVQETDQDVQAGFLMYVPVYRNGRPHETLADRRASIVGWVYAPFRMNDLMRGILGDQANNIDLEIFDGEDTAPELRIYDSASAQKHTGTPLYDFSQCLKVAGHNWHIRLHSLPVLEANIDMARVKTIRLTGALMSVLLSLLVLQLVSGRARALNLAQGMTRELRESQEHTHLLLDSAAEGIYGLDTHGNCTFVNAAFLRILGYQDASEIVGKNIHELVHHSRADGTPYPGKECRAHQAYLYRDMVHVDDEVFWRRDGSSFAVEYWSFPIIRDGQVEGAVTTFFDITERKRAEAKLAESERRFRAVTQSANDAIITIAGAGNIVGWNAAAERVFGYTETEIMRRPLTILMPERFRNLHRKGLARVVSGGAPHVIGKTVEFVGLRKDGSEFPMELSLSQWQAAEGQFFTAIVRDITDRKLAENKLRTLSTAIEQSPLSVVITDLDAKIQYANPCFFNTTGYSMEEAYGQNPRILRSGLTPKKTYDELWKALANGQIWRGEFINRRKNGELYWEEAHIAPVMDSAGDTMLYVAVKLEITQRKKAEEARQESEAKFRAIIEAIPVPLALNDAQGNITYLNRAFVQIVGYTTDDIHVLADWWPCAYPDPQYRQWVAENWQNNLDEAKRTSRPFAPMELNIRCKDGATRTFMVGAAPIKEGFAGDHLVILYDITESKRVDRVLRENETRFRNLVETVNDWIWEIDENAVYTYVSPRIHSILGYEASEIIGKTPFDLMSSEEAKRVAGIFGQMAAARSPFTNIENTNLHKDGYPVVLETCGIPIVDAEGKFHGYRGVDRDITVRKEFEKELKRSNIELEQFSYAVSHDMRQPLRMISSYLQLLERSLAGQLDGERRSYFNFAIEGAKRIDQMLVALLEYSRIGMKGEPPTWAESRAVLNEALQFLQPAIAEAQARVNIDGDWPRILVSHDEILRLIQNLIGNAIKYRIAGRIPEITVTSEMVKNEWRLCVADNGVGIIPGQIKRLFQVFQRLQSRDAYEGTGIGLALCRKIAEHHKGRIWAESAGEGQGSRFCVVLPVLREKA